MNCKFNEAMECIKSELFDKWKDDKREIAFRTLGVCPKCPVYRQDIDKEVKNEQD